MADLQKPYELQHGLEGSFQDAHLNSTTANDLASCEMTQSLESKPSAGTKALMGKRTTNFIAALDCAELGAFLRRDSRSVAPLLYRKRYTDVGLGQTLVFGSVIMDLKGIINYTGKDTYSARRDGISATWKTLGPQKSMQPDPAILPITALSPSPSHWQFADLEAAGATLVAAAEDDDFLFPSKTYRLPRSARLERLMRSLLDLLTDAGVNLDVGWLCITRSSVKSCPAYWSPPLERDGAWAGLASNWSSQGRADGNNAPYNWNNELNDNARNNGGGGEIYGNVNDNETHGESSLICHFFVFDPDEHADCVGLTFKRWSDLMQHFCRNHCREIEFYCPQCFKEFETGADWAVHIAVGCDGEQQNPTIFYQGELQRLKTKLRGFGRVGEVAKWNWVWKRCFRDGNPPRSPYRRHLLVECADIIRDRNQGGVRYMTRRAMLERGAANEVEINETEDQMVSFAFTVSLQPGRGLSWRFRDFDAALLDHAPLAP